MVTDSTDDSITKSTAPPPSANWVVDTFLKQAAWVGPHLPDPSRRGVLEWLARHFQNATMAALEAELPLASPVQRKAEDAVMSLLRAADAPTVRRRTYQEAGRVTRHTDWARSYAKSQTGSFPNTFVEHRPRDIPDTQVMRGLANLCRSWAYFRERFGYEKRAGDLRDTHWSIRRAWRKRGFLGAQEMERLRHFAPEAAEAIEAARAFWDRAVGEDDDVLRDLLLELVDTEEALGPDRREKDDLMELVAITAIARAAADTEAWKIRSVEYGTGAKPAILLENGLLRCEISKNKPGARSYALEHRVDRARDDLAQMGIGAHGYEPDVVLRFWHTDRPGQRVFAFGDAKRNYEKDGAGYLRANVKDTATAYLYAFAPLMGEPPESVAAGPHEIATAINPAITIFAYQGIRKIAGIEAHTNDGRRQIVEKFGRDDFQFPTIVAFDRHHLDSETETGVSENLIGVWFCRLARQARRALAEDRGYHFRD